MIHRHITEPWLVVSAHLIASFINGRYYYRNADRGTKNNMLNRIKLLFSDIVFLYKNER